MARKRNNGEGTLRRRSDGWWESAITIGYDVDGKVIRKYFVAKTRAEVKKKVDDWNNKRSQGLDMKEQYTFQKWSLIWFEHHKDNIKPVTQESYKYTLRILQEHFGPRLIMEIRPYDIEEFLKMLRKEGRSSSAIAQCRGMLYQIFHKADANDLIKKNPVAYADKMRSTAPKKRKEAFSTDEVKLLMEKLPNDKIGLSIRLMLGTGMRSQELLALEPRHIAEDGSVDTAEVNECFKQLDEILCALSPFDAERVIDTACDLCRKHEKSAFLLGIHLGIRLAQEARIR